jgi:hypothetical protein
MGGGAWDYSFCTQARAGYKKIHRHRALGDTLQQIESKLSMNKENCTYAQ